VAAIITEADLPQAVLDKVEPPQLAMMLAGANAKAARIAPCLADGADPAPTGDQLAEARLVLLSALVRWADAGSGAYQQQSAGPFAVTVDTRQRGGYNLWPSEIEQLQAICRAGDGTGGGMFAVDTAPADLTGHAPWCALAFAAAYCSCGADIAGYPIYEAP
jgi:hypothetical protein